MTELTKWPRLLVVGNRVTREQANEILIRTCVPEYLSGNDRAWDELVGRIMGMDLRDDWHDIPELRDNAPKRLAWLKERWAARDARETELGIFGSEYLHTSRIASSFIGGPHGWCDWDGVIFTDSYNVGKWPSTEEITEQWKDIAEAFPFLTLRSQLLTDEGAGELAGEWRVENGTVSYDPDPVEMLVKDPTADDERRIEAAVEGLVYGRLDRERGVSAERLSEAVTQVERSMRERRAAAGAEEQPEG